GHGDSADGRVRSAHRSRRAHHHYLRLRSRGAATVPAAARRRVVLRKSLIEGGTGARASAVSSRPLESSAPDPEEQAVSVRTSAAPERTRAATGRFIVVRMFPPRRRCLG